MNNVFERINHSVDFCVVGGGLAGMCAAISAARHGLRVALMQDRPVLGGNASSEIRMWVCGAHGKDNRETGIMEEIALENLYRNPKRNYPIWDTILFEKVKNEKNITLILNCSCNDAEMDGNRITKVIGWQTTTQKWQVVEAKYFADCSGDSVLAPLTGAQFRIGREAKSEFGESFAPEVTDKKTMGLSCLMTAIETKDKVEFVPPVWANKYTKEDLPGRLPNMDSPYENYWYMELGGEHDSIGDTEELRDELLKVAMGIWDYIKNSGEYNVDNWDLDFLGFLPGKRESRRYIGDYVMTERDVVSEGKFHDTVAYGGWTMDDHHPAGIATKESPNIFHPAPSPFGIPYRSLYSKNIENLFFAGRNISVTHSAMSATRVMATCAILGQAIGTAAYVAQKHNVFPRGVYENNLHELQQTLLADDCYLPFVKREPSPLMANAKVTSEGTEFAERLTNGKERVFEENGVSIAAGKSVVIDLKDAILVNGLRIVLDSDLNRETVGGADYLPFKMTICNRPLNLENVHLPNAFAKTLHISVQFENGEWVNIKHIEKNRERLIKVPIDREIKGVKIVFDEAWGGDRIDLFSVEIN